MYDLLQVMQQDGYLSSGELIALRKTCKELGENPVRVLRSLNIASPEQIQEYLQRYFRVNALGDQAIAILDEGHQIYVPIDLAIHYSCFALGEENSVLYIAMEDPSDRGSIQQLRFFLNKRIIAIAATVFQLAEGLSKIYRVSIPNLKLTTVIERSRGVVGGLRYEVSFKEKAITVGADSAGSNLSDKDSENVNSFVSSTSGSSNSLAPSGVSEGASEPSAEILSPEISAANTTVSPPVESVDENSSEIEEGKLAPDNLAPSPPSESKQSETNLLKSASVEQASSDEGVLLEDDIGGEQVSTAAEGEVSSNHKLLSEENSIEVSTAVKEEQAKNDEGLLGEESSVQASAVEFFENENELVSDEQDSLEKPNGNEIGENEIAQLSALASSALVKVSLLQEKSQAIELVNELLNPFKFSVALNDDNSYQISGEGYFSFGNLTSQIKKNDNPVVCAIDPVLKRILKMKDSV